MPKPGQSKKYGMSPIESVERSMGWSLTEAARISVFYSEADTREVGQELLIGIAQVGRQGMMTLNLTRMTEEELLATRELLMKAFDWALPTVQRRDKDANDALTEGDDTFPRVYRAVPQLVYRERAIEKYRESLHGGSEAISERDGNGDSRDGGDREPGPVLAESRERDNQSLDSESETS